ncbi:tyrosine-type recombinase/integrase [Novipirellula artificiosorum]|uniref:tyrosine-type recombinase/integrase n=1 Tax=Novipirellula artificiosorum TaxID=2528016 RepID=UPI001E5D1EC6|nr:phage integrase SAM-like domain-containing protein [Novipirellula artificiosorum]
MATADWLSGIDDDLRNKLARCGLCESVAKRVARVLTLEKWIDEYIGERQDVKDSSKISYRQAKANLIDFFGRKKMLRNITPAEGKRWRVWLKTKGNRRDKKRKTMAEDTVRRRTATAKQFFAEAVERGYMPADPFAKLPSAIQGNEKRQFFVEASVIERCMEYCPDLEWQTILALARYGAMRCPSELVALRWSDVDLPAGRMVINASKTEHHSTGGVRVCPIFPELRPYLEAAWDAAPEGAEFVINRYRQSTQNLRSTFLLILKRAGITPWPKLFQNCRASRETELLARYPAKDVVGWVGNSIPVAMKSYAMATDEAFKAASDPHGQTIAPPSEPNNVARDSERGHNADSGCNRGCTGGCISSQSGAIEDLGDPALNEENTAKSGVFIVQDSVGNHYLMGDTEFESVTSAV